MRHIDITVLGLVQGVGFRPFVARAAQELSIRGTVCNSGGIVKILAKGDEGALDEFIRRLSSCAPKGARVDEVIINDAGDTTADLGEDPDGFVIVESTDYDESIRYVPADIATCESCERELFDSKNRRYMYPFISCVSCGPRYSIIHSVPYDRERTSMDAFEMCEKCRDEYEGASRVRTYAQTIACGECGPGVSLHVRDKGCETGDALQKCIAMLKNGSIVAIKNIGGYHLCFDPDCEEAAKRLRKMKRRENKPFAVMFDDIDLLRRYACVSVEQEGLLISPARPIVLVDKLQDMDFAPSVCGESLSIGAMLPSDPIQLIIMRSLKTLVMTSANISGEPIITDDDRMLELMRDGICDAVLSNDRRIVHGLDDSIFQCMYEEKPETAATQDGRESGVHIQILRRGRGYVPEPIRLKYRLPHDTIAMGGDLKAVFALGRGDTAYPSGHFGDLYDRDAYDLWCREQRLMGALLNIEPQSRICDAHPAYISSGFAKRESPVREVYHHHAHILSVMAEHGLDGRVYGIAFDGTGYGDDGTIWGSEFLVCDDERYVRAGHFSSVKMPGGDRSSVDAGTSLYAYLYEAERRELLTDEEIKMICGRIDCLDQRKMTVLRAVLDTDTNTVYTSSMGRLFDAVSALLGICSMNTYEGECAIRLETEARKYIKENGISIASYVPEIWVPIRKNAVYTADSVYLVAALVKQLLYGTDIGELALMFHMAVADAAADLTEIIVDDEGADTPDGKADGSTGMPGEGETDNADAVRVALSGGSMCNSVLVKRLINDLRAKKYSIYMNERVPCGDGGISLGQIYGEALLYSRKDVIIKDTLTFKQKGV